MPLFPMKKGKVIRNILIAAIIAAGLAATGYVALVVHLLTIWPVNDSRAFRMAAGEWYLAGAFRFGHGVAWATVLAAVVWVVSRFARARLGAAKGRLPWMAAAVSFAIVVLSALVSSVLFLDQRPFF